jgi:hypothetical protein
MSVGYVLLMFVTSTNPLRPLPGVLVLAWGWRCWWRRSRRRR